jgi:minimal PKS acyl carrier protein
VAASGGGVMDGLQLTDLIADLHAMSDQLELDLGKAELSGTAPLADLGIDSMTLIDFLAAMERKYGVRVPDDELAAIETLGDVLTALLPGDSR